MSSSEDWQEPSSTEVSNSRTGATASCAPEGTKWRQARKTTIRRIFLSILFLYLGVALYQSSLKPLPADLSLEGDLSQVTGADVEFLYDVTGSKDGQRISEQMIFDRALGLIRQAQDFVLIDFFLFNEYLGQDTNVHRRLCSEISRALIAKKGSRPEIRMLVITDPVNEVYGGPVPEQFKALREAGIPVVLTDLRNLRDSNPIYSTFWRVFVQWFGASKRGFLPHPFSRDASGVGLRAWLALLNFKANHRKLIVADAPASAGGREMACMVMSANPHDASSAHNNIGLLVRGGIWMDLLRGEQAILAFSESDVDVFSWLPAYAVASAVPSSSALQSQAVTVRVLTEGKIRKGLLELVAGVRAGDTIDIGMFYLSERRLIKALLDAAQRGANIRVLLDPNRDAFGYQKNGIPNRPVAAELVKGGGDKLTVRWYNTHGEQFHTKMVLVKQGRNATLFSGSANLTRRNIGDFNLETDVVVACDHEVPVIQEATRYFERLWANQDLDCSVPYENYATTSGFKYWLYRFQEGSGASTF